MTTKLTPFTGIKDKTVTPFATLCGYLDSIFDTSDVEDTCEKELTHETSMELLNAVLGVYANLEENNQLESRTAKHIKEILTKVYKEWRNE